MYLENCHRWVNVNSTRDSSWRKGADAFEMVKSSIPDPVMKETKTPCNRCQKIPCTCVLPGVGAISPHLIFPMDINIPVPNYMNSIYPIDRNFLMQNAVYPMDANLLPYHNVNMLIPAALPHLSPSSSSSPPSPSSSQNSPTASRPRRPCKKFKCDSCDKSFDYKHVLQNHQRTHTGEKPFVCRVCGNRFTRDHHLKTHMRLHTGEKPYACEFCDMRFVQVANLRRHTRIHAQTNCGTCDKEFSNSSRLQNHLREHNLAPVKVCNICNENHQPEKKCPLRISKLRISGKNDIDDDSDAVSSGDSQTSGGSDQHVHYEDTEAVVPQVLDLSKVRVVVRNTIQSEPEDLSMKKMKKNLR